MRIRPIARGISILALALSAGSASPAGADGPKAGTEARRLLEQVVKAYRDSPGFTETGTVRVEQDGPFTADSPSFRPSSYEESYSLSLSRPNLVDLQLGDLRLMSDGKVLWVVNPKFQCYFAGKAPAKIDLDFLSQEPWSEVFLAEPSNAELHLLLALTFSDQPLERLFPPEDWLEEVPAEAVLDGKRVLVLRFHRRSGKSAHLPGSGLLVLSIDPDSKRIAQIELIRPPSLDANFLCPWLERPSR